MLKPCSKCQYQPAVNSSGEVVDLHDCAHGSKIDALIPLAEAEADRHVAALSPGQRAAARARQSDDGGVWSAIFHRTMTRLAIERGLRRPFSH